MDRVGVGVGGDVTQIEVSNAGKAPRLCINRARH